ncbi:hypothetical protein PPYR_06188 [Photinus pyralis]|uniref:Uncharacterized protein n=1 Tax=Photinus pyralis TaxID=7054 RepID=A0A5N4AT89_PHOPY|nr:protein PFC0760c-like [Photinus pyralis]KAB0800448.1 hypothetical protein PPYR_06188 [Photinus pyralis]
MERCLTLLIVTIFFIKLSSVESLRVPENLDELIESGANIAYIKRYNNGDDGDNERGYHKVSNDKGGDGYKHFDSFHKTDSDKYGYETHSAFGKSAGNDDESGENVKYTQEGDKQKADYEDEQYNDKDVEERESKNAYKIVDNEGDSNYYSEGNADAAAALGYVGEYNAGGGDSRLYDNGGETYSQEQPEHYEVEENVDEADNEAGNYESRGNEDEIAAYETDGGEESAGEHYTAHDADY